MNSFNTYKLNANYETPDGVVLIDPTFKVIQVFYNDANGENGLVLNWKDNDHDVNRMFPTPILSSEFPTVEFLEDQLLQIPMFANASVVEP